METYRIFDPASYRTDSGAFNVVILFSIISFSQEYPNEGYPIRDLDGNVYRIIMTESGYWMAENLKTFKLNDGTPLTYISNRNAWREATLPVRCKLDE